MNKLSLLDFGFFIAETEASPKHVAGLLVFQRPAKSAPTFAKDLYREYLGHTDLKAPFDQVIAFSLTGMPQWKKAASIDLSQHVFYHRLKNASKDRQALYRFACELHVPMLDRSRPLWETHVIDGLGQGRFAIYHKIHHAYADGVTMSRWIAETLSGSPNDMGISPIWSHGHSRREGKRPKPAQEALPSLRNEMADTARRATGIGRLGAMLLLEGSKLTKNAIALPFVSSAKTLLTGQVTPGRQFAAAGISMERINRIRERTRSTVNHVALTCLDSALRRYLMDHGVDLKRPIVIQMPVNLRRDGDKAAGNKIGIVQVELSEPTDDPFVRLRNIGFSLRNVRSMMDGVAPAAIESYTILTGLVAQAAETLGLSDAMRPLSNAMVSNVPGPSGFLYIKGARMEEMHPISTLPPSNLLNVTLFSYAGTLFFGLVAADQLPDLQSLSEHVQQAFAELEACILH
ncbi:MAG: wax ester/triacylglycerol synthase family O-acyltransferase [Rhodoferax sp.]|nr:wax ester/triacylglycerol synthase family O-acyltransferase [Rhodoferax sp.]